MSNARKLQTEIDRVMKKVDEGSELFDEIWLKVKSADSQNLKEKHEVDLKKEIKKLQRLRDQIKTWIGSSDVKDKDSLMEARKLIETKMETFKICEKETKTKTYSKEGLAREDKLDPEEEAKMTTTAWLQEYVDKFQEQVEEKDFEIEKLSSGKGKKTNKHHIEDKQEHIANHRFHINKLEGIIRLVNNDVIEVDAVDAIKDDLDYHLESYEDEDYRAAYDEEFFYETLGLEDIDVGVPLASVSSSKKTEDAVSVTSSKGSRDVKSNKKASSVIPLTIGRARSSKADRKAAEEEEKEKAATPSKKTTPAVKPAPTSAPRASTAAAPGASMAAILKRETELQEKERQKQEQIRQEQVKQEQLRQQQIKQQQQEQLRQQEAMRVQLAEEEAAAAAAAAAAREREQLESQQRAAAEKAALQAKQPAQPPAAAGQSNALDMLTSGLGGLGLGGAPEPRNGDSASVLGSLTQSSTSTLKTATSGSEASGSSYLTALNESFVSAPGTGDAERSRSYTPQNPYPTLPSYPTNPSPIFDNPAVFEKLGTDCLFFIFYYAQGTYQQYLAARELKKQSWRFHKKYQAWFQRHEEPKITTDEYEQGTYVYFDYETGWCTRIKQDFRFEYSYLEDSLQ